MQDPAYRLDSAVDAAMTVISGKWKASVLCLLHLRGNLRFCQFRSEMPDVSAKVLTNQLRELESDGLIERVHCEVENCSVYALTDMGRSLIPVLEKLADWATTNMEVPYNRYGLPLIPSCATNSKCGIKR